MSENRSLLDMLQGQGQGGHGQNQGLGLGQGQGQPLGPPQGMHGPPGMHPHPQQMQHQQQQQQHSPMGDMHPPMSSQPYFQGMNMPPPPMGQMMPGFGFNQQPMDQHPMYMPMMHPSQRGGPPPMGQFPSGPSPQPRPPQSNALASLLQSLNQSSPASTSSTTGSAFGTSPHAHQQVFPAQPQPQPQSPSLEADLQASTNSLKLALFGGPPKPESPSAPSAQSTAQQKTESLKMALFGGSRPELAQPQPTPKNEEVNLLAMLQKSTSSSPVPPSHTDTVIETAAETKGLETRKEPLAKSPASKDSTPQSTSKAKFTYVNPFSSFTSSSNASAASAPAPPATTVTPPSHSRTGTPLVGAHDATPTASSSKRSSFSTPGPRRETPTHTEPEITNRAHDRDQKRYQVDQLLPPNSAWNHRVQKLAKGSTGYPDGVYLSRPESGPMTYDTGLDNLDAIFSEDLETIPITLIPTDVEYNHGKMVSVSKGYISYAAKGGKIRVIQQSHGHRTLLRGHTDQVIDMGFSVGDATNASGSQLLASVGKDSRLIIWNLSGSDVDSSDIAHSKYLEVVGRPQTDQPRYSRIAWNPAQASILALVNNDDHSVLIVNIENLVGSQESITLDENQLLQNSIVIQAHKQAINDIAFSPDGSVIVTASEDGSVKFWEIGSSKATFLSEFIPHGGLGVTNAVFVDEADTTAARGVVTACRRGTELSLWLAAGLSLADQLVFKEPHSSIRRSSLGKSASRLQDMRMFNFMGYDYETSSLVLANSARLSLFGIKVNINSALQKKPLKDISQAQYMKIASESSEPVLGAARFDFLIEFPMPQPIVSFVVMPDSSLEYNGFSVYCIQAKAVQQYIIKGLEPHDKANCKTLASAAPSAPVSKSADQRPAPGGKASTPKASSPASTKHQETAGGPMSRIEVPTAESLGTPPAIALEAEKEVEKVVKLHGPVINGAIAKLKEKKRNSTVEGADKKEVPVPGRSSGKTSADVSPTTSVPEIKKPQTIAATVDVKTSSEATKVAGRNARQSFTRPLSSTDIPMTSQESTALPNQGGNVTISMSELQSLLLDVEERLATRFEKKLVSELEQQARKMDHDQITRQEVVLKMVSQTLTKSTEQLLVQTVNKEIQGSVVPALNKVVGAAVERQMARTMSDVTAKTLPSAVDTALGENMSRIMSDSEFMSKLTEKVSSAIRPSIEESFKDSFTKVLIPSYQKATQVMFQQIHATFQSGMEDLAASNQKDHETIERLSSQVQKVSTGMESLQALLTQTAQNAMATPMAPESSYANQPHMDQQRRSVTSGLQRALQGEDTSSAYGGSRRPSQQTSPVENRQSAALNQLLAHGNFETAFTQALSTNDPAVVYYICGKVSPRAVFQPSSANPSGTLSQPVLLALTHHLANDQLSQNLGMKLTWLQEVLLRLEPKDPLLGDHMARILPSVQRRLEDTFEELSRTNDPNPHKHTLQMLLRHVQSMQL
ncbi:enhancer of mRNA-decapping protein 4 [Entomortierella parvispora]|uniref:Enhancer of mRNA-decapping protein 4 n=1 Tax=Entomortierella parvispora TaxID=205924 RepID=A0A9P3H6T7_9FUNG|nr:enhancer of mRNA-decapping protein 4 [Entomortierella parvispora]